MVNSLIELGRWLHLCLTRVQHLIELPIDSFRSNWSIYGGMDADILIGQMPGDVLGPFSADMPPFICELKSGFPLPVLCL